MLRSARSERRRGDAGFTLIEVLVALAVIAVVLTAIGSLVAASARGTRSIDAHLALVETARAIETGLPSREDLKTGSFSGELAGHRWRVDVQPFAANVDSRTPSQWIPLTVVIRVQSPAGSVLQLDTVRLRRRPE
ncbi:MAG: ral secretion pathway protein [Alphaproteobacteria bacterium]|nr:ral secretion pathway protein [Alphaproteobacteria bacterium]MEA2990656.1 ral secretion pathway protein [Alphaproteobacteria bacterium]